MNDRENNRSTPLDDLRTAWQRTVQAEIDLRAERSRKYDAADPFGLIHAEARARDELRRLARQVGIFLRKAEEIE